ncbi:UNVERIFIED_CONTAM: hypothetical protein NCL1_33835 [Trichonephila clavipes]
MLLNDSCKAVLIFSTVLNFFEKLAFSIVWKLIFSLECAHNINFLILDRSRHFNLIFYFWHKF